MTPSQIIYGLSGARPGADCTDLDAFHCWVCGGPSSRGMLRARWMGARADAVPSVLRGGEGVTGAAE